MRPKIGAASVCCDARKRAVAVGRGRLSFVRSQRSSCTRPPGRPFPRVLVLVWAGHAMEGDELEIELRVAPNGPDDGQGHGSSHGRHAAGLGADDDQLDALLRDAEAFAPLPPSGAARILPQKCAYASI